MINDKVTLIEETREKKTKFGVLGFVYGRLHKGGALMLRSIRFPGEIPVNSAQSLCAARGGQFSPATPLNPQHQMLSGYEYCIPRRKREILESLVQDFEMPFAEVSLADWPVSQKNELPDSSFALVLFGGVVGDDGKTVPRSHRKLPFKNERGIVDKAHLRNALATMNRVKAPAKLRRVALTKLLRAANSINMDVQSRTDFNLKDLDFYLDALEFLGG